MTEEEFLAIRMPFWLEEDDLRIMFPSNTDKMDVHSRLSRKYNYNWLHVIRGYYWPGYHCYPFFGAH